MSLDGLVREGMLLVGTAGGPLLGVLLLAGLVIGVMQAATQINDPAVGFLPRLAAAGAVLWLLGAWMMERFAAFFARAVEATGNPF